MANLPFVEQEATAGSGGGVPALWVSGNYYSAGVAGVSPPEVVTSPSDYQGYIRIISGAGTTDPSSDTTNWRPYGARAIKSIQRGTLTITGGTFSNTAAITAVVTAKSLLSLLGQTCSTTTVDYAPYVVLTNSTTITATRMSNGPFTTTLSWEVVERY